MHSPVGNPGKYLQRMKLFYTGRACLLASGLLPGILYDDVWCQPVTPFGAMTESPQRGIEPCHLGHLLLFLF